MGDDDDDYDHDNDEEMPRASYRRPTRRRFSSSSPENLLASLLTLNDRPSSWNHLP